MFLGTTVHDKVSVSFLMIIFWHIDVQLIFCALILYPPNLINSFILSAFLYILSDFLYMIMLSLKKETIISHLFQPVYIFFSCLKKLTSTIISILTGNGKNLSPRLISKSVGSHSVFFFKILDQL